MEPIVLTNSVEILSVLSDVALRGNGFVTECLMAEVMDAGLSEPDYLNASGTDPEAYYKGEPNAWGSYHVRQSKKVVTVYGGAGGYTQRRFSIADTP